jgi:hypothetical protein
VLHQILVAWSFGASSIDQLVDHIPLVIAGENQRFFFGFLALPTLFVFDLEVNEAGQAWITLASTVDWILTTDGACVHNFRLTVRFHHMCEARQIPDEMPSCILVTRYRKKPSFSGLIMRVYCATES